MGVTVGNSSRLRVGREALSACLLLLTAALLVASLGLSGAPPGLIAVSTWFGVTAVLGGVIVRRSGSLVGWLMQLAVAVSALAQLARSIAEEANRVEPGAIVSFIGWVAHWLPGPALSMFVYVILFFPTDRLPGPRWRFVAWTAGIGIALVTIAIALSPGALDATPWIRNPLGLQGADDHLERIENVGSFLVLASVVSTLASLVVRLRRAEGDERAQMKWVLFAATLFVAGGLFAMLTEGSLNEVSFVALLVGLFAFPIALTVALTRYRLYDIDLVINRTVVYSIVTAVIIVFYILIVGMMGALLQRRVGLLPALFATGVIAVIFQPLRRATQNATDRTMFGQRRDPYGALASLSGRLESTLDPQEILPAIVNTVATSLKLGYVAIEVENEGRGEIAASHGTPPVDVESTPLVYQGREVGRLIVAPRRGESLTATDRRLLTDLARSAGPAVHAVALTAALRSSRKQLLAAREEERRRLRRDLHDGLGPELAGITLALGAAVNLAAEGDPGTMQLLQKIKAQADAATRSIRGLVEGLRPAALDDLGLVGAVREKGSAIAPRGGMAFDVIAPWEHIELPAAVEVAALRIALEAVNNAVKHSSGTRCTVTFHADDRFVVEVADDGVGLLSGAPRGVGLLSMRERAEEVGGSISFEARDAGGTLVKAELPLS